MTAITYSQARHKTLSEVMDGYAKNRVAQMTTSLPGVIISFDSSKQTATVSLLPKQWLYDDSKAAGGFSQELPHLTKIPVTFPRAGNLIITFPVTAGDECLVVFSHKSSFLCYETGKVEEPLHLENGAFEDAVIIMHQFSKVKRDEIVGFSTDSLQIRTKSGDTSITVDNSGEKIIVKVPKFVVNATESIDMTAPKIKLKATSTMELDSPKVTVTSSDVIVNSPDIALNGAVTAYSVSVGVGGGSGILKAKQADISGPVTADSVAATGEVTSGSVSLSTHIHPAGTPPGTTGAPIP